jgi:hypothetical protein
MWIGTAFILVLFGDFIERLCISRTRMSISVACQMFALADTIDSWPTLKLVSPALRRSKPPREKVHQGGPSLEAVADVLYLHAVIWAES